MSNPITKAIILITVLAVSVFPAAASAAQEQTVELIKDGTLNAWRAPRGRWKIVGEVAPKTENGRAIFSSKPGKCFASLLKNNVRLIFTRISCFASQTS